MNTTPQQQFHVISPGLFTTVQDRGRYGFQKYGVPVTGVLDMFAAEMANYLVGNPVDAAVLECTLIGPALQILDEAFVAVTGAEMPVRLNGKPVARWSSLRVHPGDELEIGQAQSGCRGYLAVTGGVEAPLVMGSRSCYTGAGIGGHEGRPVQAANTLARGAGILLQEVRKVPEALLPKYPSEIILRAIPGPQDEYFGDDLEKFFASEFKVSPEANRMGYRLEGPDIRQKPGMPQSIISEPSVSGGVQIPPNGQPIVLLVEQTVGGYTKIATVVSCDLDRVAQALPGDRIRFEQVDLERAYSLGQEQQRLIDMIKNIIELTGQAQAIRHKDFGGSHDMNDVPQPVSAAPRRGSDEEEVYGCAV